MMKVFAHSNAAATYLRRLQSDSMNASNSTMDTSFDESDFSSTPNDHHYTGVGDEGSGGPASYDAHTSVLFFMFGILIVFSIFNLSKMYRVERRQEEERDERMQQQAEEEKINMSQKVKNQVLALLSKNEMTLDLNAANTNEESTRKSTQKFDDNEGSIKTQGTFQENSDNEVDDIENAKPTTIGAITETDSESSSEELNADSLQHMSEEIRCQSPSKESEESADEGELPRDESKSRTEVHENGEAVTIEDGTGSDVEDIEAPKVKEILRRRSSVSGEVMLPRKNGAPASMECSICLDIYQSGDTIAWADNNACIHAFHKECIMDYLLHHKDGATAPCPVCRRKFSSPKKKTKKRWVRPES